MSADEDSEPTAVARNDGRVELALKASNEGIWDWWIHDKEIYYSRRILEFLECGDRNAPNVFLPPHGQVHLAERASFARAVRSALEPAGPELLAIDCRLRTGGGKWCWLRIRGTIVRDSKGNATRVAGSMIDISRRKAAEAQIEEDRHLLRMLIDHVPLQVYFKDRESRFYLANRQQAEWMGLEHPSDLIGKHDRDFFRGSHSSKATEDEQGIMETGKSISGQLERESWEGRKDTWVLTSKFPWLARDGSVKGTFGVSSNVTDLVEAQTQVAEFADALAMRNQSYEEEVQLAREIQQALASSRFPKVRGNGKQLDFGSRYLPISGLAGDFFEVIQISNHTAGLLICDVMGHGVRAALIVAMLRGLLEKQRKSAADPGAFLGGLNSDLAAILERAGATMFATAFYAVIDLNEGSLRAAIAGHPAALILGPSGVTALGSERSDRGPGLGIMPEASYPQLELPLSEVRRILLFTDGILEAENGAGEPFFEKRLAEAFANRSGNTLDDTLDGVVETVLAHSEDHSFDDDVCLLAAEIQSC